MLPGQRRSIQLQRPLTGGQIGSSEGCFSYPSGRAGAEHHCISPNRAILVRIKLRYRRNARFFCRTTGGIHAIGAALGVQRDAALSFGPAAPFFASPRTPSPSPASSRLNAGLSNPGLLVRSRNDDFYGYVFHYLAGAPLLEIGTSDGL